MTDLRQARWQTADGLRASYLAAGSGPPVLMVHGGGSCAAHYGPVMTALCAQGGFYAPDLRGFGEFRVPDGHEIGFATWAHDLCAFLEWLDLGPVVLCGWSLGAALALMVAAERPELVDRLVLFGAPDPARAIDFAFFERRLEKLEQGATEDQTLAEIRPHLRAMISPRCDRAEQVLEDILSEQRGNFANLREVTRAYFTRPSLAPMAEMVQCPVTLVVGEDDRTCDMAGALALCERLEHCDILSVADCGHYYFLEKPQEMAAILSDIIASGAASVTRRD